MEKSTDEKDIIYCLKGFAIVSVVYAHCKNLNNYDSLEETMSNIVMVLGCLGVPIFFVLSGYLYHRTGLVAFLKKKRWHFASWIFTGSVVWLYEVIRKGLGYAKLHLWLLGIGTYLWYMTTLLILWILFLYINEKYIALFTAILFIVSELIFDFGIIPAPDFVVFKNVLRFSTFFLFGYCTQIFENNSGDCSLKKYIITSPILKCVILFICVFVTMLVLYINNWDLSYYSAGFHFLEISIMCILLILIGSLEKCTFLWERMKKLGKYSYSLYLLHMPVAGAVCNICSRFRITRVLCVVYPALAIIITYVFCYLYEKIVKNIYARRIVGLN